MNRHPAISPARLALPALAAALALAGCTSNEGLLSGEKVDYRSAAVKSKPLDVPPDLTQLSRENRYATQGGVVSAAGSTAAGPASAAATGVVPPATGGLKVERAGDQRWLAVPLPPEQLWPVVKAFWTERGFKLETESPELGIMETEWAENRAKLPQDMIRGTIGRFFSNLFDSGERDRYRTRIERTPTGSEVFITHRGLAEVYTGDRQESTAWNPRPRDPALEAEFLTRLMARLGSPEPEARTAVAAAPEAPARARAVTGNTAALEVDEPFDRAWRRVGLALDRGGFSVEDRDRAGGLYFVRYVDPKFAGKEEPGWWDRLTGKAGDQPRGPLRYRIAVKAAGDKTVVSVLTSTGAPEPGENGQRIVGQLVKELR